MIDLHIHTNFSDGTYSPEKVVAMAKEKGIDIIAITDHDEMCGCENAINEAHKIGGIDVLAGIEITTEVKKGEIHIVGVGLDCNNSDIKKYIEKSKLDRMGRFDSIVQNLKYLNMDIEDELEIIKKNVGINMPTRHHIAIAMKNAGYVETVKEAFDRFLSIGGKAYVPLVHIGQGKAIELIKNAGGVAILAHPCNVYGDVNKIVHQLKDSGLDAIEAFHPSMNTGDTKNALSLAKQLGLFVSAGSDFHGENKKERTLGCSYVKCEELESMEEFLLKKYC